MDAEQERFLKGQQTRALARLLIKAHRARREPESVSLPKREVPESYVWERCWGFWRKRPTTNTAMAKLPKAIGEK